MGNDRKKILRQMRERIMKYPKLSPDQQKAAAIMFYDFHKSPAEIARRLDVPASRITLILDKTGDYKNVLSQIHSARTARGRLLAKQ